MPVEQRGSMRRTRTEVDNSTWHWEQQKQKVFESGVGPSCRATHHGSKAKEGKVVKMKSNNLFNLFFILRKPGDLLQKSYKLNSTSRLVLEI